MMRERWAAAAGVMVALVMSACGGSAQSDRAVDPAVRSAMASVTRGLSSLSGYRGPVNGVGAQPSGLVVFVAADRTNGGIAGVARGVQEAVRAIGWRLQILDGQATPAGRRTAMRTALQLRPNGIILGGFDAREQERALQRADALGIPVVGWHAGPRPGPDRRHHLFTNIASDPRLVAQLAARYVIADSGGRAQVVIVEDPSFSIATYKAAVMAREIRSCRGCRVLDVVDTPIAHAEIRMPVIVLSLLHRFGPRFRYLMTINGAYITGSSAGLQGAGRKGDAPPFAVAAGDGDASEFARIRADAYQRASIAEPLYLQGWQLIDELNRARAGQPPSDYVAPPRLVTRTNVPNGSVFDPPSGYRARYLQIWGRS
jgi:ribose transport system substrate-binding protein